MNLNETQKGYLEIGAAVAIWAVASGIIVRWINKGAEIEIGAEIIYGVGAAAGFFFVLFWLFLKKETAEIKKSLPWRKDLSLIGLLVGLNNGFFYAAIILTTVANAILTHYLEPILLVLIFAPIVLKQKTKRKHIVASVFGFAGLLIILWPQINSAGINIGILLGLASAVFFAWYTAIESKLATTTKINSLVQVLYKNGVPALLFLPFVVNRFITVGIDWEDFVKLAFFGVLVLGVSFVFLYRGLAKVSSQNASVIFYGEPVGAIILASIVWNESLSATIVIGGILILVAGFMAVRNK